MIGWGLLWAVGIGGAEAEDGRTFAIETHPFAAGVREVRRPVVDGVAVIGASGVVGRDLSGREGVRWRASPLPEGAWRARWGAVRGRDRAIEVGEAVAATIGEGRLWAPRAERAWWWGREERTLAPVWSVALSTAAPLATWRLIVGADSGAAIALEQTSRTARGRIYPTSPALSEAEIVELPNLQSAASLVGTYTVAASCGEADISESLLGPVVCRAATAQARPDAAGDYLFAPDPAQLRDPFAEVQAYWHVDRMIDWLGDCCDLALPIVPVSAFVNFPMANAFYGDFDGDGVPDVAFGTDAASGIDLAYDADVVYHELGHAVVDALAPDLGLVGGDAFGLQWAPGAAGEGAADVWSLLMTGDPALGEYTGAAFGRTAVRDLSRPRRCPDDLGGEVHHDGEILASFGWALIDDPAVDAQAVADLMAGAIPLWDERTDWPAIGASLRQTLDDLLAADRIGPEAHARIDAALAASGMETCGRVVPLDGGRSVDQYLITGGLGGDLQRIAGGNGLSVEVPEDAVAVTLQVDAFEGDPDLGWALYGRVGQPVGHDWTQIPGLGLGFATPSGAHDWAIDGAGTGRWALPVAGGETLYLALASRDLGGLVPYDFSFGRMTLSVQIDPAPPAPPVGPRGCGCGGVGRGAGSVGWGVGWGLIALVARRYRVVRGG